MNDSTRTPGGFTSFTEESWNALADWEERFDRRLEGLGEEIVQVRRHLHAHPEPSGEEVETTRYLADRLRRGGFEARVCRSDAGRPVGIISDIDLGRPSEATPRIALRADMDALRVPDEKDAAYRSTREGLSHSCGHDVHSAILLGIALAAAEAAGEAAHDGALAARLRFLFQPAEETSTGARWLVQAGALNDVDAILGMHVDPEQPVGTVGVRYGTLTAHCDEVEIVVSGHGGHAARPHHTIDPVAAAAQLIAALYQNLPRAVDSRHPSVFTVGRIEGGYAPNVIPERVRMYGSLRTTHLQSRVRLMERIREICHGVSETTGVKTAVEFHAPLPAVYNDPEVAAALDEASCRVLGRQNVMHIDHASMGGEDFAVYLEQVPGALLRLGCAAPGRPPTFLHSTRFDVDERVIAIGMRIMVRAALLLSTRARQADV